MIRLLTAVFLLVTILPKLTLAQGLTELKNGTVADAEVLNQNFSANNDYIDSVEGRVTGLEEAIDALPTPPTNCDTNQIIKWNGTEWVCTWPADTASIAFKYVFNKTDWRSSSPDRGELSIEVSSQSWVDPQNPPKEEVIEFAINQWTPSGVFFNVYLHEKYRPNADWISIRSASDPSDFALFKVTHSFESDVAVLTVSDFIGDPTSSFTFGEAYIIEFQ